MFAIDPNERYLREHIASDVRRMSHANAPGLMASIEELSKKAGVEMPDVYLRAHSFPNAGMHAPTKSLLLHDGLLRLTNDTLHHPSSPELRTVIGHELGHFKFKYSDRIPLILSVGGLPLVTVAALHIYDRTKELMKKAQTHGKPLETGEAVQQATRELVHSAFSAGEKKPDPSEIGVMIDPDWRSNIYAQGRSIAAYALGLGAGLLVARQFAMRNEFRADKFAVQLTGDPHAYINLLNKMEGVSQETIRRAARQKPSARGLGERIAESIKDACHWIVEETISAHPETKDRIEVLRKEFLSSSPAYAQIAHI